jgi:hypothetical protein
MASYSPRLSLRKSSKSVSAGPMTPLKPKMKCRMPQLFLFKDKIWYGDISLWNLLSGYSLYKKLWAQNDDLNFQRDHINFSGVNAPAEIVLAGSMIPLKSSQRGQWHRWTFSWNFWIVSQFRKKNLVRKILVVSAGSITPLKSFRRGQW